MNGLWKDKYEVSWCGLCDVASIACPVCKATSCNGTSCSVCHEDFSEFCSSVSCCAEDYCSQEEMDAYDKVKRIQRLIVSSIQMGDNKIDWERMEDQGNLCEHDRKIFNLKENSSKSEVQLLFKFSYGVDTYGIDIKNGTKNYGFI